MVFTGLGGGSVVATRFSAGTEHLGDNSFSSGNAKRRRRLPRTSVSPNWITQSLIAVLAGLQVPFLCTETHELGEELVASYLYQVHLYHWLETNDYGRFLSDQDL
jgi:hypothetical protein